MPAEALDAPTTVQALAGADVGTRAMAIARMQRGAGNASVARALESAASPKAATVRSEVVTQVERYPFTATIRRGESGQGPAASGPVPAGRSDAGRGAEHGQELAGLFESLGAPAAASASAAVQAPEADGAAADPAAAAAPASAPGAAPAGAASPGAGVPISIPDIEIPILAEVGKSDTITGGFTYSGSITRGGAAPSGFGVTRSFSSKLTGITITPGVATFAVAATYEHPITYQVRSGTGPNNEKDIASDTDAKITKANFATVHSDLTPNMGDLNGRPPRTQFWAEDLTLRHEKVHADDDKANGPAAMATVTTWLEGQAAASDADVRTHLTKLPGRFASALLAALTTEDGEKHAYGDGAPSYKARADKVKEKGDKGDYA